MTSIKNVPVALTVVRIALVPFVVLALIKLHWELAFVLFSGAAVTDMLDGHIARAWGQTTAFGAFLDPLADKVLTVGCYGALWWLALPVVPSWFFWLMAIKEFILMAGGVYGVMHGMPVQPTLLGKGTMVLQVIFLVLVLAMPEVSVVGLVRDLVVLSSMVTLVHYGYLFMGKRR